MPGSAHETLIEVIKEHPWWLDALLEVTGHPPLRSRLVANDSALRLVDPIEVHPDAVFADADDPHRWAVLEVQLRGMKERLWRWLLAAAILLDHHGQMGDVVVITHDRSVASASERMEFSGPGGTSLALRPIVIRLTAADAEVLLDSPYPELALFAAWAVHDQSGVEAQRVVQRAAEIAHAIEDPVLQAAMRRNILMVLGEPLLEAVRKMAMDPTRDSETPWYRAWRQELEAVGEARGEARMLLMLLERRGFAIDTATRVRIENCQDSAQLEAWFGRALSAASLAEVFGA